MAEPQMSELVSAAVEKASRDTVADSGGMITGFVSLVTFIDNDGCRCWAMATGEDQSLAQSLGMADILESMIRAQVEVAFMASPDEDDES